MKAGRFVSQYLKAKDVRKDTKATIASAEVVKFKDEERGGERESLVVFFKEIDQGVVLCKASLSQLIELTGSDETDEWIGKKVVMFNDPNVFFHGKPVGGIRFKAA